MHSAINSTPGWFQPVPGSDISHSRSFDSSGATKKFVSIARLIELCEEEGYVR